MLKFFFLTLSAYFLFTNCITLNAQDTIYTTSGDKYAVEFVESKDGSIFFFRDNFENIQKAPIDIVDRLVITNDINTTTLTYNKISQEVLRKLSGVKYADFSFSEESVQFLINNPNSAIGLVNEAYSNYLKEDLGFRYVIITESQREMLVGNIKSLCDVVYTQMTLDEFESDLGAIGRFYATLLFKFCDNSQYEVQFEIPVNGLTIYSNKLRKIFKKIGFTKSNFVGLKKLKLFKLPQIVKEAQLKESLDKMEQRDIQGIYETFSNSNKGAIYRLGLVKKEETYYLVYLSGSLYEDDWEEGEIKAELFPTSSSNHFLADWYDAGKNKIKVAITVEEDGSISVIDREKDRSTTYIKIY